MSKSYAQKRIIGMTDHSVRIKWDRLGEVLTQDEKIFMNKILGKLIEYDKKLTKEM
jgi:hypothetical protein